MGLVLSFPFFWNVLIGIEFLVLSTYSLRNDDDGRLYWWYCSGGKDGRNGLELQLLCSLFIWRE